MSPKCCDHEKQRQRELSQTGKRLRRHDLQCEILGWAILKQKKYVGKTTEKAGMRSESKLAALYQFISWF